MILRLEQHRPDRNRFRFHEIEIGPDLFDITCLRHRWGRIGRWSRERIESFASEDAARAAADDLARRKTRRGYVLLPQQLHLPLGDPG